MQLAREFVLFKQNWSIMLACLAFQLVHAAATKVAYILHQPRETLRGTVSADAAQVCL